MATVISWQKLLDIFNFLIFFFIIKSYYLIADELREPQIQLLKPRDQRHNIWFFLTLNPRSMFICSGIYSTSSNVDCLSATSGLSLISSPG